MAAKDKIHDSVVLALQKDGWTITHDPYILKVLGMEYEVDLGAEMILAAEQEDRKIAVEIKSFIQGSFVYEFHQVLGQFLNYKLCLEEKEPDRILYLAIPDSVYETSFQRPAIQKILTLYNVRIILINTNHQTVIKWLQ